MIITTLLENDSLDSSLRHTHGLSLHISWNNRHLLFDLGPNSMALNNAVTLGVSIENVDGVILSHGHYDHGGGLKEFVRQNQSAIIYASSHAFDRQSKKVGPFHIPIGVKWPKNRSRVVLVEDDRKIEDGFYLYRHVTFREDIMTDDTLFSIQDGLRKVDHFDHEMYLVLEENERVVLFSGCSHKGIENIVSSIEALHHKKITDVIGGFHLYRFNPGNQEQAEAVHELGKSLKRYEGTNFYSCHCTGEVAYATLQMHLGDQIQRIMTGSVIEIH